VSSLEVCRFSNFLSVFEMQICAALNKHNLIEACSVIRLLAEVESLQSRAVVKFICW
jgi:hypothetical protein